MPVAASGSEQAGAVGDDEVGGEQGMVAGSAQAGRGLIQPEGEAAQVRGGQTSRGQESRCIMLAVSQQQHKSIRRERDHIHHKLPPGVGH